MQETQEMWVWFLGWEGLLEKEMATHSSVPAWRVPWTEEPRGLQSMGSQRVTHDWNDLVCTQASWVHQDALTSWRNHWCWMIWWIQTQTSGIMPSPGYPVFDFSILLKSYFLFFLLFLFSEWVFSLLFFSGIFKQNIFLKQVADQMYCF